VAGEQIASALRVGQGVLIQSVEPLSNASKIGLLGTRRSITGISAGRLPGPPTPPIFDRVKAGREKKRVWRKTDSICGQGGVGGDLVMYWKEQEVGGKMMEEVNR